AKAGAGHRAPLPGRPIGRRDRGDPRHRDWHGEEAAARRSAARGSPAAPGGGRHMTFDSRARRAAQGIHRAVEVMEMSSTKTPNRLTRFDQYRERKSRK